MRQINYNDANQVVRFEFPAEWDASAISGLTLQIADKDATELAAASAATIYTATSIDDSDGVSAYSFEITLDSAAGNLAHGDPLWITGVEGSEYGRVAGYDSTNKIVTLEQHLEYNHDDDDAVYGRWAEITVDTSVVATYPAGKVVVFTWTPAGTGQPTKEEVQVSVSVLDIEAIERRFSRLYPRAYNSYIDPVNRFTDMVLEAEMQVRSDMLASNPPMDIQRVIDQEIMAPVIMAKMACMWTWNGDDNMADEREFLCGQYTAQLGTIKNLPLWTDDNQDGVEDDDEVSDHAPQFDRAW